MVSHKKSTVFKAFELPSLSVKTEFKCVLVFFFFSGSDPYNNMKNWRLESAMARHFRLLRHWCQLYSHKQAYLCLCSICLQMIGNEMTAVRCNKFQNILNMFSLFYLTCSQFFFNERTVSEFLQKSWWNCLPA